MQRLTMIGQLKAGFSLPYHPEVSLNPHYAFSDCGAAAYLSAVLSRSGCPNALYAAVADDPLGRLMVKQLSAAEVGLRQAGAAPQHTDIAYRSLRDDGPCDAPSGCGVTLGEALQGPDAAEVALLELDALADSPASLCDTLRGLGKNKPAVIVTCDARRYGDPRLRQADVVFVTNCDDAFVPEDGPICVAYYRNRTELRAGGGTWAQAVVCRTEARCALSQAVFLYLLCGGKLSLRGLQAGEGCKALLDSIASAMRHPADLGAPVPLCDVVEVCKERTTSMIDEAEAFIAAHADAVRVSPHRPNYHIAARCGWINDPNGLIQFGGVYHVYYQYHPYSPEWGPMYWGHASSRDLAHWTHERIALAPDQAYEAGCFSGSAANDHGVMTLVYTAHNETSKIKETQCIARSVDGGKTFVKSPLNPVISTYPPNGSSDFRDPKVWFQNGQWQMAVGTSFRNEGRLVLYSSDDLEKWSYRGVMCASDGSQGTMWECPNFAHIDGADVLILSPMGLKEHKCIYILGDFDCESGVFTQKRWAEMDMGDDFYAPQVFTDERGRTLLIGWMNRWTKNYHTQKGGWVGALTIPRVLSVCDGRLRQQPVPEMELLHTAQLLRGPCDARRNPLEDVCGDSLHMELRQRGGQSDVFFKILDGSRKALTFAYHADAGEMEFSYYSDEKAKPKRTKVSVGVGEPLNCSLFIDRSSFECFAFDGAVSYTKRIYPAQGALTYALVSESGWDDVSVWTMGDAFDAGREQH